MPKETFLKVDLLYSTPNPLDIIESAIRICHDSEKQGDETRDTLILRIIKLGHESVLEHGLATFKISGISRACSHQLVRHRIASYSQRSQRYINESNFEYIMPPNVEKTAFRWAMEDACNYYKTLQKAGATKEDARFVLPNACTTDIIMTMNFRSLRHFLKERLSPKAQWEIKNLAKEIHKILLEIAGPVFCDINWKEFQKLIWIVKCLTNVMIVGRL